MSYLKSKFGEFTSITPIHGLGFAHHAKTVYGAIVWLLLVLFGAALFCRDLYNILELRESEPTTTTVNVISSQSLYFDRPQICITTQKATAISGSIKNTPANLSAEFQSFIGPNGTLDYSWLEDSYTYPPPTKSLVALIISGLATQAQEENCLETGGGEKFFFATQFALVYEVSRKNQISLSEIAKFGATALCGKLNLDLSLIEIVAYGALGPVSQQLCRPETFLSLTEDEVCFKGPPSIEFNSNKEDQAGSLVSLNFDVNFLSLDGQLTLYGGSAEDKSNSQSVPYRTKSSYKWAYDGVYNSYNRKNQPCSSQNTECRERCKAKKIFADICGCWPLRHLSVKLPTVPLCPTASNVTKDQLMKDVFGTCYDGVMELTKTHLAEVVESCATACPKNCLYQSYSFVELRKFGNQEYPFSSSSPSPDTFIWLKNAKFVYPKFEESPLFTTDYLITQVGGSLGLWLGGSVIAILHIPIFFFKIILHLCKSACKKHIIADRFQSPYTGSIHI